MQCPACKAENSDHAKFCLACGSKLVLTCPTCGAQMPLSAHFCAQCGAPLDAAAGTANDSTADLNAALKRFVPREFAERLLATRTQGSLGPERRVVTILFCDVKGSTAMAEDLDPEEVMDIMNGAFEYLIAPVYRHEGTLARLMGDAILAFFGAPIAHEDDPERAVRAGLEILAGVKTYAEKLERERGLSGFNVRIGINTGRVVVGEVGSDLRVEYTAMGDAINLASRMEQNAPPGGILITHDTYRHMRGVFDVQRQIPLAVKGKSDPVQTYLVLAAKPRAFRTEARGIEGVETRMIARESELLALQQAYAEVVEDVVTRVVTVSGEAGVGKSRLLAEFDDWIELRPERIYFLKGRAGPGTQQVPFGLIRDMFAYRFAIQESDPPAAALEKFRAGMADFLEPARGDIVGQMSGFDFRAVSPHVAGLLGSPSFGQQARAYFAHFIATVTETRPVVMVLEDGHWADDSSLDLIAYVVEHVGSAPLLVVIATRPELYVRRPSWGEGQEAYSRLELKPLSRRAGRQLVGEILQKIPNLPESLRNLVVEAGEGNPFYCEEFVKMLIDDRVIVPSEEAWQLDLGRLGTVRVPQTLAGILQARLDNLPPEEKAVLQRAAVVGRLFWDRAVEELSADALPPRVVDDLLAEARTRELVFRREWSAFADTQEYSFRHALLRDVTYETVLLKLRRKYHAQAASWLEAHAGERLAEYLGVIAGHYEEAGDVLRAAGYLRRSGEEALKISGYRDARAAFERALKLLPAAGPSASQEQVDLRTGLLVDLGQALVRLGEFELARVKLEQALGLARPAGLLPMEAAALAHLGLVANQGGNYRAGADHLQKALQLAQEAGQPATEALALRELSVVAYHRADYAQAIQWAEAARDIFARLDDRRGVAACLNVLGVIARWQGGRLDQAAGYYADVLRLGQETGDRRMVATALNNLGDIAGTQGAFDEARDYFEQCRSISEEIGDRPTVVIALYNLSEVAVNQGKDDAAAERYLGESLRQALAIGQITWCLYGLVIQARLDTKAGRLERAAELMGLVRAHPGSDEQAMHLVADVLPALQGLLGPGAAAEAMARGAALDLAQTIAQLTATQAPASQGSV